MNLAHHESVDQDVDALIASLDGQPLALGNENDLVVLENGAEPRVVPHALREWIATLIGGPGFAQAIAALERPPGHLLVLVVVPGAIQVAFVGLRATQKGGAA
jgi:hypothetical protein